MALVIYNHVGMASYRTLPLQEPLSSTVISKVQCIRADAYELNKIRELFETSPVGTPMHSKVFSIPMIWNAKSMIWWGDIAKTILSNLNPS